MSRRSALASALAATLLLGGVGAAPAGAVPAPEEGGRSAYVLVAAPDFLNQDVADVRTLPTWRPGLPNSWAPELEQAIDAFLDEVETHDPRAVLVPGDLVGGRWGRDDLETGLFGPTGTPQERSAALRRAADFYFEAYRQRFAERGLTLHAGLGDHDVGDNPWSGSAQATFKRRHVDDYKQAFADHFTRRQGEPRYRDRPVGSPSADTAYAVKLAPELLLVTVDQFHRTRGDVRFEVVGQQLRWLRDTLREARRDGVRWVVVQGHNPVLWPVRSRSSSDGHLRGGARSPFWRTLARFDVDLYLSGEVHDTSMRRARGVTQVSTGGLLYTGDATYLTATVHPDRMILDVRELVGDWGGELLWQTSGYRTRSAPTYAGGSRSAGRLVLHADGDVTGTRGKLRDYRRQRG